MKNLLQKNWVFISGLLASLAVTLQQFIGDSYAAAQSGLYVNPWGAGTAMNNDMYNMFFAGLGERMNVKPASVIVMGIIVLYTNFPSISIILSL